MKKQIARGIPPLFLALLLCGLLYTACRKDEPPPYTGPLPIDYTVLPPATQTGAGTFGCLVNGKVWVPRVPLLAATYQEISSTISEKNYSGAGGITCNLEDAEIQQDDWLSLRFPPTLFDTITFCTPTPNLLLLFRNTNGHYYRSDIVQIPNNCIKITKLDTISNVLSGIFSFTLFRDSINLGNKLEITDGRFDLKYSPQ